MDYKMTTIAGDATTPIALYQSLQGRFKALFESSAKHEESGRYSFIAVDPLMELTGNHQVTVKKQRNGQTSHLNTNILQEVKALIPKANAPLPFSFFGGAIGYIGYEMIFNYEKIGERLPSASQIPDVHLFIYDQFIVFDHKKETITFVAIAFENEEETILQQRVDALIHQATQLTNIPSLHSTSLQFTPSMEANQFKALVRQAKQAILDGEVFQIVLSQKFTAPFEGDAFSLYRKLRTANPSPYMFYIDFEDYQLLGTSPESLVKVTGSMITTNPIAGTRPRGKNTVEDQHLARELLQDEKELAEHKMLIDLSRNDLGKISNIGSITIKKYANIEKYQHVMHIVSEVTGELPDDLHALDALMACLPAGTVTGAPKIRAMQLINELESEARNHYAGAVGYISFYAMDFALAIRTMLVKDHIATVQAGAGIVYDSDPQKEYEETLHKARALLEVIQ